MPRISTSISSILDDVHGVSMDFSGLHNGSHPVLAEDTSLQAALQHATPRAAPFWEIQWRRWEQSMGHFPLIIYSWTCTVMYIYIYIYGSIAILINRINAKFHDNVEIHKSTMFLAMKNVGRFHEFQAWDIGPLYGMYLQFGFLEWQLKQTTKNDKAMMTFRG